MQKNLVIVESPAKAKTIEKFLGGDYKVMSSYGHIRDLKKKELSINEKTFTPDYEIPADKKSVVKSLKENAKLVDKVWLASDEDREGEAISWHLCEVLGLDEANTNRIVFHEITKPAILNAIESPRRLDMNLVNAQQARRVLDRIVGFKLSPVLWRKVKPSLSAGRVQSVAVRLIVEREREIQNFKSERYYRINAIFTATDDKGKKSDIKAELNHRFTSLSDVSEFFEDCKRATFKVKTVTKKPQKRMPAPPFTTSTLQQEASRKLGMSVSRTMSVAQHLYENGQITYMRTDSVNLSKLCLAASKEEIEKLWGKEYSKTRQYQTHSKGAQEAHEAIRPTYMNVNSIEGTQQEQRLYELIWKRTIACQMAEAEVEKTVITISIDGIEYEFVANGEVMKFDGFMKVYRESTDDEATDDDSTATHILPDIKKGDVLERKEITSTERFTMSPQRYTEASLVHRMEELGIGRPSTYAPTISTIQQREYVQRGDKKGVEREYSISTLVGDAIKTKKKTEMVGKDKGKLIPTDIGIVVNDYLTENFPDIMDYNFTAKVERDFDEIAEGKEEWHEMLKKFDSHFEPVVEKALNAHNEYKAGERMVGEEPSTGKPVFVKIGRYGPVAQIGTAEDKEKPRFAQLPADKSLETITLEEVLSLFRLPREMGEYEGQKVVVGTGRFGPYVMYGKSFVSIPKTSDPLTITLDECIELIRNKAEEEKQRHLKTFEEDEKLEVMNGRYGAYLVYDGNNYKLTKAQQLKAKDLTYEECMAIVNNGKPTNYKKKKKS